MDCLGEGGGYTTKIHFTNEIASGYLVEGFFQVDEYHEGFNPVLVPGSCLSVGLLLVLGYLYDLGQVDEVILA